MSFIELDRDRLSNGITIIANSNKNVESVAFAGSIKSGAMLDPSGGFGTAELVSRLLTRGTKSRTGEEISQKIEEMGATLQFSNYDESVSFTGRCHSDYVEQILRILSDCLCNPSFKEDEVEKAKGELISDLEAERDETRSMAYRSLLSLIYGKYEIYGRDPLGSLESALRLTSDDATRFHETHYNSETMIIAATGRFERSELVSKMESALGSWHTKKRADKKPDIADSTSPSLQSVPMEHKSQVDIGIGARAVPRSDEEFYSLNLGNLIFGRIGLYGRLGKSVRDEKGLAYYCFSALQSKLFAGHIAIMAGVNPKNVERGVEGITEEIRKISSEPLSEQELLTGRKNLRGSLSLALESSVERASLIHDIEYFSLGLDYIERYAQILDLITSESVLKAFEKYFKPEMFSLAAAGPVASRNLELPGAITVK
ncbi:MAG: M16 family metallopeptidase [Nitrososphaerales archaeon]